MSEAVVLLSGGIDSAVCLALAAAEYETVTPVHISYGQQTESLEDWQALRQRNHIEEQYPGTNMNPMIGVDYSDVFQWFAAGVASDRDSFVTEDGELEEDDGRSTGYVPMRNLHFIATAAGIADVHDADAVYIGVQGGDEESYPDCRMEFIDKAAGAVTNSLADDKHIDIRVPLIWLSKEEVIAAGEDYNVAWEYTYSCYEEVRDPENPEPCGECPACIERIEAFEAAEVNDPIYDNE